MFACMFVLFDYVWFMFFIVFLFENIRLELLLIYVLI